MPSFIVEDGTGLSTATSLCSVATADDHFATHPSGGTLWDPLHVEEKEARLIHASLLASRRLRWRGNPLSRAQAFPVPATELYDHMGRLVSSSAVPADVARAIAELAGIIHRSEIEAGDAPGIKSRSTGPVSVTYATAQGGGSVGGLPPQVIQYLEPYVFTSPMLVRA